MTRRTWQGVARAVWAGMLLSGCASGRSGGELHDWTDVDLPRLPGSPGSDAYDEGGWGLHRVDPTVEPEPPPDELPAEATGGAVVDACRNGLDDDEDGLVDCEELGCLGEVACCVEVETPWAPSPESCLGADGCGWAAFAPAGSLDAVRVEGGALVLSGPGPGEAGVHSAATIGLTGAPGLAFVASAGCPPGPGCRAALGVALTGQGSLSSATGVVPEAGLVLDGELGLVRLYVGGRLDRTVPASPAALAEERGYALRVEADGRVAFWLGLDPAELTGSGLPATEPTHRSAARVDVRRAGLRLAGWSRLDRGSAATLRGLRVDRRLCPSPGSFARVGPGPLLLPSVSSGLGRPAVARAPGGGGLVVVYERDGGLEVAASDDGLTWSAVGPALSTPPATPYGQVARRAPALLAREEAGEPVLHLWYEAVAELGRDAPEGLSPTAIAHAVSSDGLSWAERPEDAIALTGVTLETAADLPRWRWTVGQPTVVEDADGSLVMWFVGRDPASGRSALGLARSADGATWQVDPLPVAFDALERLPFEADGRAEPVVLLRGSTFHMWYVGQSGAREAIGYAVSGDGVRWDRFGPVLEAAEPWEGHGVAGPAVLVDPAADPGAELVRLFYSAGPRGREVLGLAAQEAPAL